MRGIWYISAGNTATAVGFLETIKIFVLTPVFSLPLGLVISFGSMSRFKPLRTLTLNPQVLCFDESVSALGPELTGEVLRVIRGLKNSNTTMIVVAQELVFARSIADVVIYIADGVIEEMDPPEAVFDNPVSEKNGISSGALSRYYRRNSWK